jgi:hypothetical protein
MEKNFGCIQPMLGEGQYLDANGTQNAVDGIILELI